jgi:hypothetical protein
MEENMNRNPFLTLITIAFLLFSLSPSALVKASDGDLPVRAVAMDGHWTGTTSRGQPMSFDVSAGGPQWATFKLKTDFVIGACSGTVETTVPGPGAITNNSFSWSGTYFSFNGQFSAATTASGNYSFTNEPVTGCGTFSQSGTWSATTTVPLPGAFSKLSPGNAATSQPLNPTLSWGASTNATGYDYCYATTNPCSNWMDNGTATSVALGGLTPGATYYWQVRARNGTGTTLADGGTFWSFSVIQIQILPLYLPLLTRAAQLPASFGKIAPANGASGQSTSLTLSWAASANATSYEYCFDTTNPCSIWTDNGTATSKALSGLSLSTTYYWQVRARNAAGTTYADGGTGWSFTTASSIPAGIVNGDFEAGITGWTEGSSHGWPVIVNVFPTGVVPHSGSQAAWLGGEYDDISFVQQQVTISAGAPYLVYWHWIASSDACGYDFGGVLVNSTVVDVYNLCSSANTGGWVKHSVNLGAYVGQSIMLQIRAETDSSLNSNLFVDDVSLAASGTASGQLIPLNLKPDILSIRIKPGLLGQTGLPQVVPEKRFFTDR